MCTSETDCKKILYFFKALTLLLKESRGSLVVVFLFGNKNLRREIGEAAVKICLCMLSVIIIFYFYFYALGFGIRLLFSLFSPLLFIRLPVLLLNLRQNNEIKESFECCNVC
jgi:hypothetical protein